MKRNVYLVFVVILTVRGVTISNFMSRNPTYDNRATLSTDIISTLILGSPMYCASHCTRNDVCKSIMFNMDTHDCQLLSVYMSDTGPQPYIGRLYYEKINEGTMPTTAEVETTVVSTETTPTTFDCSIWHQRLGHWYMLDTNYRTFNDSRSFCASLSPPSYVIEVDSQAENDWFFEFTLSHCGIFNFYWLNGYDTDNSGSFTWIKNQTPAIYTNWYTGEPNDFFGTGSEKCIASSNFFMKGWHDIGCSSAKPVVCERDS
ncbi:collectin-12-like [Crassostrea angulata]|uniref:collectin-12-like n=1 Tax=Magallana angulata TaxID=2784310 RepID=UPI0022B1F5F5|nr:collectin-12-like [Crassostrea angulata]